MHTSKSATAMAFLLALFALAAFGDRCSFPQYRPTRVKITCNANSTDGAEPCDGGIFVQRPERHSSGYGYEYAKSWSKLVIKGCGYSPVPAGVGLDRPPNGDYYGLRQRHIWIRDLRRMREMGVNVIRVWNWNYLSANRHTAFLDELYDLGMYVLVPFMMGTPDDSGRVNYEDLKQVETRRKVIGDWSVFVASHAYHPAVLGFLVGNEVEKTVYKDQMVEFFSLLNVMVDVAHETERAVPELHHEGKWHFHPISTPLAADGFEALYQQYFDTSNIDFWSLQPYGDNVALNVELSLFDTFINKTSRFGTARRFVPLLLTERGFSALTNKGAPSNVPIVNTSLQAEMLAESWAVVRSHTNRSCIGMMVMEWNDEWWKDVSVSDSQTVGCPNPLPDVHSNCSTIISAAPRFQDQVLVYEEWLGICEQQEPREQSMGAELGTAASRRLVRFIAPSRRFCVRPRAAYYVLKALWADDYVCSDDRCTSLVVAEANRHAPWWCGEAPLIERILSNPLLLVLAPSVAILVTTMVLFTLCKPRWRRKHGQYKSYTDVAYSHANS